MKAIKISGMLIATLGILFFGIAMFLPSAIHIERSVIVPASSQTAFDHINDLRQWKYWSPWHKMDPNMNIVFEDYLMGKGASYKWDSEQIGSGKLVITESMPHSYIVASLHFEEQGTATSRYYFEAVDEGTRITWTFESDLGNGPMAKYSGLLVDNMIGSDFEQGLANLKNHIQNERFLAAP